MKVFLDASALVPLVLRRDEWALPLRRHLRLLHAEDATLITSTWTYYEALTILRRVGFVVAAQFRRMVDSQVSVLPVSAAVESDAVGRFFSWADKKASVVDHANLLVAIEQRADAILTFDSDFVPIAQGSGVRILR